MSWKTLVPRFVKVQTNEPTSTVGDGSRWWRGDRYVDFETR
jgi:hypothetical protein